jgi:flagellar biosynthesis/type III secretory pathway chaperone
MENELIKLMQDQERDLRELLELLETQYKLIMSKDAFGLEGLVDELGVCGKKIAKEEVQRRNITGDESIKEIVSNSGNEELKELFGKIQDTLNKVILQKETNDILLKQKILFNNKMLQMLNPNRENKMYNSYGNLSK